MAFDMPKAGTWEERGGWVVRALIADINLKIENSAGLVGNLGGESGEFEDLQEKRPTIPGSKGGRGWAQWTGYSSTNNRRKLFEDWCVQSRLDPDSDEGNYGYLVHELQTTEKTALARIRAANGLTEATRAAHVYYERSGDQSWSETNRRLELAKRALAGAHQADQPPDPVPAPSPGRDDPPANALAADYLLVLQAFLQASGDYTGDLDGLDGPLTRAAVAAIQKRVQR